MPIDPEFLTDCPYGPGGVLIDEILSVDKEKSLIRARMPTSSDLPLTREQRAHPVRHPSHVSGGLMVHLTGMMGFTHAYFILGLRHIDGWVGYGTRIHKASFRTLAHVGEPLELECRATDIRRRNATYFNRYAFRFSQAGKLVYEGDQSAVFLRLDASSSTPPTSTVE